MATMSELAWFAIGMAVGGTCGIALMCLFQMNREDNEDKQT